MRKLIIGLTLVTFVLFVYTSHATIVKQDKQKTQVAAEKKADTKTAKTTTTTGDKKCADKKDCKKDGKCCKDKGTKSCCKKDGKKCDKDMKKESEPKK